MRDVLLARGRSLGRALRTRRSGPFLAPPSASAHLSVLLGEREQQYERARLFLGEWPEPNRLEQRLEKKGTTFPTAAAFKY